MKSAAGKMSNSSETAMMRVKVRMKNFTTQSTNRRKRGMKPVVLD
jgi:hypothetical protein